MKLDFSHLHSNRKEEYFVAKVVMKMIFLFPGHPFWKVFGNSNGLVQEVQGSSLQESCYSMIKRQFLFCGVLSAGMN